MSEWYFNTTKNDLNYWGLDYPPLTAYHSYLVGKVAEKIDPKYVALGTSRGLEEELHKVFMRATVLVADMMVYGPSCMAFGWAAHRGDSAKSLASSALLLTYPGASTYPLLYPYM
jgi:alpha-1,3-glucosyltransferase